MTKASLAERFISVYSARYSLSLMGIMERAGSWMQEQMQSLQKKKKKVLPSDLFLMAQPGFLKHPEPPV